MWISRERKENFLDEIRNIFNRFWRAIISWKSKIYVKKVLDTSFNKKEFSFLTLSIFLHTNIHTCQYNIHCEKYITLTALSPACLKWYKKFCILCYKSTVESKRMSCSFKYSVTGEVRVIEWLIPLLKKKTLQPLFKDGVHLSQGYMVNTRRQFTFYHKVIGSSYAHLIDLWKTKGTVMNQNHCHELKLLPWIEVKPTSIYLCLL